MNRLIVIALFAIVSASAEHHVEQYGQVHPWQYVCDSHSRCVKEKAVEDVSSVDANALGWGSCVLTCEQHSLVFPKPHAEAEVSLSKELLELSIDSIQLVEKDEYQNTELGSWLSKNVAEQKEWLEKSRDQSVQPKAVSVLFSIDVEVEEPEHLVPKRTTNESYSLTIDYNENEQKILAKINAKTYFGARHGIETLFQLIAFDALKQSYVVLKSVSIQNDRPEFEHRGLSLDTARSFVRPEVIVNIINGLAASKLNVLHWHIVDSQSFPLELLNEDTADLTKYGAYAGDQIYKQDTIKEIVEHAHYKGVRVIPEIDQPAHVGAGWNSPKLQKFLVCFNKEPWYKYCVQPPCGQLNPGEEGVYDVLESIYSETYDLFNYNSFHLGADEVHHGCWQAAQPVVNYLKNKGKEPTDEVLTQLAAEFVHESTVRLRRVQESKRSDESELDVIVWSSGLTENENVEQFLPKQQFIVQFWGNASNLEDKHLPNLVQKGYRVIFSNYENLYLDCGYGAWVGEGNNWCSPYKSWQAIYSNDPYNLLQEHNVELTPEVRDQVLGGEVAIWSEQTDSESIEGKIFPRASALAERLWSNPRSENNEDWYSAETRVIVHRDRVIKRGIKADQLQPTWCLQNTGHCYSPDYFPKDLDDCDEHENKEETESQ